MWQGMRVEVRGQFVGVGSLIPPCGLWGLTPGLQVWQQCPYQLCYFTNSMFLFSF